MPDADLIAMSKTAAGIWKRCSLDVRKVGLSLVYHRIIINLRIQGVYSYLSIFDGLNIDQGQHMGEIPTVARHIFQACPVLPWIPEPSTVNNKLKRGEGSGSTGRFFD